MNTETIDKVSEGNKIIAEFMGRKVVDDAYYMTTIANDNDNEIRLGAITCYHSSWDWLMSVVEKIEHIKGVTVMFYQTGCEILLFGKQSAKFTSDTKIEAVWLSVVEFIKRHN